MVSVVDPADHDDENVVDRLLADCEAGYLKWEQRIADEEDDRFTVEMPDVEAVVNRDGRLLSLWLDDSVMAGSVYEFQARMNEIFGLLRQRVLDAFGETVDAYGEPEPL